MNATKPAATTTKARATKITHPFRPGLARTQAGSPVIHIDPNLPWVCTRELNRFIYVLAAELERRSKMLNASWAISPEVLNRRIVIEISSDAELVPAEEMLVEVMRSFGSDF